MSIPPQQLQTWSNLPDSGRYSETYASIVQAIHSADELVRYQYDVYLQGSYANATNIRADSDVDVVVELTSSFRSDISTLSGFELHQYLSLSDSTVTLDEFRRDILAALRAKYGWGQVTEGSKCLKVAGSGRRLPVDVLPAQQYRLWRSVSRSDYEAGIVFRTRDGRDVVNYPKQHRDNGRAKHAATNRNYKGLVRAVKNARRRLVEDGLLSRDVSPSYFVECILYNVPTSSYTWDISETYLNVLIWLGENQGRLAGLRCQNEITDLFGPTPEQWDTERASQLILALLKQWSNWNA